MFTLIFRHVPYEDAGRIAPVLAARGIRIEYADLFRDPQPPKYWRSAAGLIFMGGPMSANDGTEFIRRELALIEEARAAATPMLGVCLGAQLLARAAGARVYRNPVKEIGWAPVSWTEAALRDPLFADLAPSETVFHWHGETFDLPEGAEHLAWSSECRNQAFRLGNSIYGLQFHLEVTPPMIADWCARDSGREVVVPIDANLNEPRLEELAGRVFGRWADLLTP
ncbi:MAG TPA: gamma-glutamyl-gamma-aminobutyrate hydrolase family protein [Bryobacteraceae bacterium]